MTITASGLADYSLWDATAGGSHTIDPVTAGRRVAVKVWYWSDSGDDPLVAGDLTQTAGTATIGTPILASQAGGDVGGGIHLRAAVFWVPVTGSGSLTLTLAANSASYGGIAAEEFATDGTWDDTPEDDNGQFSATDSLTTYNTGSATSAGAAVFLAALCWNTGSGAGLALSNAPPWVSTGIESDASSHEPGAAAYRIVSSGTTDAGTWTGSMTADTFAGAAAAVAVFKEAAPTTEVDQAGFRYGIDDGAENAHSHAAAENTNITAPAAQALLLNWLVDLTGDPGATTLKVQVALDGTDDWSDIPVQ